MMNSQSTIEWMSADQSCHALWHDSDHANPHGHHQINVPQGSWVWNDDQGIDIHLACTIAADTSVQLLIVRKDLDQFKRRLSFKLGDRSTVKIDILDQAALVCDELIFACGAQSSVCVNQAVLTSESRSQVFTVTGGMKSQCNINVALHLTDESKLSQRANFEVDSDDMSVIHKVHGVASGRSKGVIESFVFMPRGAKGVSSQQFIKTFALDKAHWKMTPDLIIKHQNVIASHGACHGVIDSDSLSYASSRALPEGIFREMFYRGFLKSVFDNPSEELTSAFELNHG